MLRVHRFVLVAVVCAGVAVLVGAPTTGDSQVNADMQAYMAARTSGFSSTHTFSFGVYSDIHMIENSAWGLTRPQWQSLLTTWRDRGDLFGVIVGDLGYGLPEHIGHVLSGPAAVLNAPPIFYQMGNHEMDGVGKRAWIDALYPGAVSSSSWTVNPAYSAGNGDHVYYSFNVGATNHFIVLDGDFMTYDGFNVRARQSLGQAQLSWFAADVAANAHRNIFVFVHQPIDQQPNGSTPYYMLTDRGSVLDILAAHPKQKFIFSGHFHNLRGITQWRGVTSVHVMHGAHPNHGVRVSVAGEQITLSNAGTTTAFDAAPMNTFTALNGAQFLKVAEDGSHSGFTREAQMIPVGPENGVVPTFGTLMLKATNLTWYQPRFISEQLVQIVPGMRFSYDIYLSNVSNGKDAVTVQPDWHMKNGQMPPIVVDQHGIRLSRRTKDGLYFLYNEDVPLLGGRATDRWYHRDFDLTPLAGHYVDGVYLTSNGTQVNVGAVYVDNIRFTVPSPVANTAPVVTLTAPADLSSFPPGASVSIAAVASDPDGTIARVDFLANGVLIGTRSAAPYAMTWTGMPAGNYVVSAVAFDMAGASTTSAGARIQTAPPPLVQNGTFDAGLSNWQLFATPDPSYVVASAGSGVLEFYRVAPPPGQSNQTVVLQNTGRAFTAGQGLAAQFDLGNSSAVRKRISVLIHEADFSDSSVCTFWLAPNTAMATYQIRTHTTKSWSNATISFYAATPGSDGGFYRLDNVGLYDTPGLPNDRTDCVDPTAPVPVGGADGPDLLTNGTFSSGTTQGWVVTGQLISQVSGQVFHFYRPAATPDPAGVIMQSTGQPSVRNQILTAQFELGNSSNVRKRVTVLLHDWDFGDLSVCTFWLQPGQALSPYAMRTFASRDWTNTTLSIYAATVGDEAWIHLDNVSLRKTPGQHTSGTDCAEPGSTLSPPPVPLSLATWHSTTQRRQSSRSPAPSAARRSRFTSSLRYSARS